jgi:hypothetical protein
MRLCNIFITYHLPKNTKEREAFLFADATHLFMAAAIGLLPFFNM